MLAWERWTLTHSSADPAVLALLLGLAFVLAIDTAATSRVPAAVVVPLVVAAPDVLPVAVPDGTAVPAPDGDPDDDAGADVVVCCPADGEGDRGALLTLAGAEEAGGSLAAPE